MKIIRSSNLNKSWYRQHLTEDSDSKYAYYTNPTRLSEMIKGDKEYQDWRTFVKRGINYHIRIEKEINGKTVIFDSAKTPEEKKETLREKVNSLSGYIITSLLLTFPLFMVIGSVGYDYPAVPLLLRLYFISLSIATMIRVITTKTISIYRKNK